ncbi:aldehyde dehydrogenase family protein, partial [Pseudomonas sp. MAFF212428]|nr:aldehyde dehydrogenase family protein [Pseudomonas brassicae]
MTHTLANWICGAPAPATSGQQLPVYNPATGAVSGQVQLASHADVAAAVASAQAAFPAWSNLSPLRRSRVLNRFLALL